MMKKLIHYIFNNKHEKLILLILPLSAIIIASCVLIPQIIAICNIETDGYSSANLVSSNQPYGETTLPSLQQDTSEISNENELKINTDNVDNIINTHLTAQSIEKDLYIFIRDEHNQPISGQTFNIQVKYPNNQIGTYNSDKSGLCYLVNLTPGTYEISMLEHSGYSIPAVIKCNVKDTISYQKIENVEELIEIKDISEGLNEIKTNEETISNSLTTIDYISSNETVNQASNEIDQSSSNFLYDSNGNTTYIYSYRTDTNGYLLDNNGESTEIIPNIENGILVCGFKYNKDTQSYETVELFNEDNTPKDCYSIKAEPVTSSIVSVDGWQNEDNNIVFYSNGEKLTGLKNIDGKLYYFDSNGYRAQSVGIDVSFYNGNINWAAVKNAGIDFAIIRIGFRGWGSGAIYQDTCFSQNIKNAKAAGIKVGVYFYSTAVSRVEAVEEASICLEWLNNTKIDFPVFIDMEFSGDYPNGRQDKLSSAQRTEIALAFCETIKNAQYSPGIYATESFLSSDISYNAISQFYIWLASFTEEYRLPQFKYRYDMWQFTDFGKVAGVNGSVDFSIIK